MPPVRFRLCQSYMKITGTGQKKTTNQAWIEGQNQQKIYPDFGNNCRIEKIEVLQNMPNLAGINAKAGLAKYMIQGRVVYMEYAGDELGL